MPKNEALNVISTMPDDVTWDDIMYSLYVIQKIDKGLYDIEKGAVFLHDMARERLNND